MSERCARCGARAAISELCTPCAIAKERSDVVAFLRARVLVSDAHRRASLDEYDRTVHASQITVLYEAWRLIELGEHET